MTAKDDPSTIVAPRRPGGHDPAAGRSLSLALTIQWHFDLRRVGESATIGLNLAEVSRKTAPFDGVADIVLSRGPFLSVHSRQGEFELRPGSTVTVVEVEGERLVQPRRLTPDQLRVGVMITLADAIVVCLHLVETPILRGPAFGLVGNSDVMEGVRRQIDNVADLDVPVLIRGETGTGKELVARAVAAGSRRAQGPFVAVNMATIPPSTAADELFGHEKGAFTGASDARPGYFAEADGGTLFLDEIGTTPPDIQTMLLRVIEDGEVRPLGSRRPRKVNVRLLAATDADLESAAHEGRFAEPLLHRLSRYQVRLPALRERRMDVGPLFLHFLRKALETTGELARLAPRDPTERPWLDARDFARIARSPFPGNVRRIMNITHQLAISSRGKPAAVFDDALEELLRASPPGSLAGASEQVALSVRARDEDVGAALLRNNYNMAATAASLGINRSTLYDWIRRNPGVTRPVDDLTDQEVVDAYHRYGGDTAAMAAALRVPPKRLKRRLTEALRVSGKVQDVGEGSLPRK
ncbi:MAG: sigma-54 dependent transcriptional regulator [Myxococcales bacterium]